MLYVQILTQSDKMSLVCNNSGSHNEANMSDSTINGERNEKTLQRTELDKDLSNRAFSPIRKYIVNTKQELNKKFNEISDQIKKLESENNELRKENDHLSKENLQKEQEVKNYYEQNIIDSTKESITTLEVQLNEKDMEIDELKQTNKKLKEEASKYQSALGAATNVRLGNNDQNHSVQLKDDVKGLQ